MAREHRERLTDSSLAELRAFIEATHDLPGEATVRADIRVRRNADGALIKKLHVVQEGR